MQLSNEVKFLQVRALCPVTGLFILTRKDDTEYAQPLISLRCQNKGTKILHATKAHKKWWLPTSHIAHDSNLQGQGHSFVLEILSESISKC